MGFFSSIFGKSSTTEKVVDGVINGTDKLFFTDEEKSEASLKKVAFALEWLKASSAQNLARRLIALEIVTFFLASVALLMFIGVAWPESQQFKNLKEIISDYLFNPFMMIMGFYFMAHLIRSVK